MSLPNAPGAQFSSIINSGSLKKKKERPPALTEKFQTFLRITVKHKQTFIQFIVNEMSILFVQEPDNLQ